MSKKKNIVEINGTRYDAKTGEVMTVAQPRIASTTGQNLDGVLSKKHVSSQEVHTKIAPVMAVERPIKSITKKPLMDISRSAPKIIDSHAPQKAHTLMRTVVQKPSHSFKRHTKVTASVAHHGATAHLIQKPSIERVDPVRSARAQQVPLHNAVSHFSPATAVHPPQPIIAAPIGRSAVASIPPTQAPTPGAQPSYDIFEQALQSATSHEQVYDPKKTSRGRFSSRLKLVTAASLLVIVFGGVVAYHNVNSVNLYMASNKAGFQAGLPTYQPSGFGLKTLSASTGDFAASYTSHSDSRAYALDEKPSPWDSQTLLDSFVVQAAGQNYETISAAGRTIYVYGNHNATWVNGGVWYRLSSQGALSTEQITHIVTSI